MTTYNGALLGFLPGGNTSRVNAVSSDGTIPVGFATDSLGNFQAVYWLGSAIAALPQLPDGQPNAQAGAISGDNQTIVGYATDSENNSHAVSWTGGAPWSAAPNDLGFLPDGVASQTSDCSGDGSSIVGFSQQSPPVYPRQNLTAYTVGELISVTSNPSLVFVCVAITTAGISAPTLPAAYALAGIGTNVTDGQCTFQGEAPPVYLAPVIWTDGEPVGLPLFGGGLEAIPTAVSGDGTIVVGYALDSSNTVHAVVWTGGPSWTVADLGPLAGGSTPEALGISADGSTIVGSSIGSDSNVHAVSWTGDPWTTTDLGLIGGHSSVAKAANDDGSVIVGQAIGGSGETGAIWLSGVGQLLPNPGSTTNGTALGVSADGNVIGGLVDNGGNSDATLWGPAAVLNMANVIATSLATESPCTVAEFSAAPSFAPALGLRWSDDRGQSFGNPVAQSFGVENTLTQPQWNRTGYARDRVFELFWSAAVKTALNGAFVIVEPWKS